MCAVVPLLAASVAIAAVGTAKAIHSSVQQGSLARKAAARNALIGQQAGALAEGSGEVEAARLRSKTALNIAKAKASMLAQGIDPASAGLKDLVTGMAETGETEAQITRNNAARQAWGYRNQASTALYEGSVAASRADSEAVGAGLSGAGSILGGAASIYSASRASDGLEVQG
jgi:hypothetical protein